MSENMVGFKLQLIQTPLVNPHYFINCIKIIIIEDTVTDDKNVMGFHTLLKNKRYPKQLKTNNFSDMKFSLVLFLLFKNYGSFLPLLSWKFLDIDHLYSISALRQQ
jgi:hypothetical protein